MKERIVSILTNELRYSEHVADITADDLIKVQPQLQLVLQQWLDTREIINFEIYGFSIKQLIEQRRYTFPSALISMDWLLTEPDIAIKELSEEIRR